MVESRIVTLVYPSHAWSVAMANANRADKEYVPILLQNVSPEELRKFKRDFKQAKKSFKDADDFPNYKFAKDTQVSIPFGSKLAICCERMLTDFAGRELTVGEVIERCNKLGYEYTVENLKDAMRFLERSGDAIVDKLAEQRRMGKTGKRTLGVGRTITFLEATYGN